MRPQYLTIPGKPLTLDSKGNLVEMTDEQFDEVKRNMIIRIRKKHGTKGEPKWFSKYVPLETAKPNNSPDSPPRKPES